MTQDFRTLEVWQKCRDLRIKIWKLTRNFPDHERYRLTDQLVRASRSATACIAEGYGRYHYQENIQFCRQSRGSLFELIDHFVTACECEYITDYQEENLIKEVKVCIWILNGYIKYLKTKKLHLHNDKS